MANAPELWYQVIFQPGVVNKLSLIPPYNECTVNFSCNQHIKVFRAWSIFGIYDGTQKGRKIVEYTNRDANVQISFQINAENHMKHGEGVYTILFYVENDEGLSNMYSYLMSTEQDSSNLYLYDINELKLKAIDTAGEPEEELDNDYLCFTSQRDGSTIGYIINGSGLDININYYSYNDNIWTSWDGSNITLNKGESIYIWNKTNTLSKNINNYFKFTMSGLILASGDINSMINFSELTPYCYTYMFLGCTSLTKAPNLSSNNLKESCYEHMFHGCTGLIEPPKLQARNLDISCYAYMFLGCTNLTKAPILPAITLYDSCYFGMFTNCKNLSTVPNLPATNLVDNCYVYMFQNCTSLTKSPDLLATTLDDSCYFGMFSGCTNLTSIKLYYTGNFNSSFNSWVYNINTNGTIYYNGSDTTRGENAIPLGWDIQTFTP